MIANKNTHLPAPTSEPLSVDEARRIAPNGYAGLTDAQVDQRLSWMRVQARACVRSFLALSREERNQYA